MNILQWIKHHYTGKPLAAKLNEGEVQGVNQIWNYCLTRAEKETLLTKAASIAERPEELIGHVIAEILRSKRDVLIYTPEEFRLGEAINYFKQRCYTGDKKLYEQITGEINGAEKLIQKRNKAVSSNITPDEINRRLEVIINRLGQHYGELTRDCISQGDQNDVAKIRVDEAIRNYVERTPQETFDKLTNGENALQAEDIFDHIGRLLFGEKIALGEHISKISAAAPATSPDPSPEIRDR